jgi:hypothetical protein
MPFTMRRLLDILLVCRDNLALASALIQFVVDCMEICIETFTVLYSVDHIAQCLCLRHFTNVLHDEKTLGCPPGV